MLENFNIYNQKSRGHSAFFDLYLLDNTVEGLALANVYCRYVRNSHGAEIVLVIDTDSLETGIFCSLQSNEGILEYPCIISCCTQIFFSGNEYVGM